MIPSEKMRYMETYNASEGFFGLQDQKDSDELLLLLDYGIFYEFIPMEDWLSEQPKVIPLWEVEEATNYAMVISTNGGLWRYQNWRYPKIYFNKTLSIPNLRADKGISSMHLGKK